MKVAVIGSRTFVDRELLVRTLETLSIDDVSITITEIISGGAKGADRMAEEYADSKGLAKQIFLPEYKRFGRYAAPLKRNLTIVENADVVVAFWDQKSSGTKNALDHARKLGKKLIIVRF